MVEIITLFDFDSIIAKFVYIASLNSLKINCLLLTFFHHGSSTILYLKLLFHDLNKDGRVFEDLAVRPCKLVIDKQIMEKKF